MIERSDGIKLIITALHKVQGELSGVVKDAKNPHYKSSYASLEAVVEAAKPSLQTNGITFMQAPGKIVDGAIEITTVLWHTSGEWMASTLQVPLSKKDPQGVGSAITYGCRYSLMAMLGLPPVDDDGEAAIQKNKPASEAPIEPQKYTNAQSRKVAQVWKDTFDLAADVASLVAIRKSEQFIAEWPALLKADQDQITTAYGDRKAELEGA